MIEVEESCELKTAPSAAEPGTRRQAAAFTGFLVVYTGLLGWFCWVKVLAFDEMLSFYTERVPTVAALLAVQRLHPVSLDPPLMHVAAHWALGLGLNPVFCVRLPGLVGAALMMGCVSVFVRRLAGLEVAAFAVVGLLLTDQFHMVEARPYGALLGLAALALVLWQNALRGQRRGASLAGLFLALWIAAGSHYFGVLLVVPFLLAECVRFWQRRKLDPAMLAALSGSVVAVLLWLPYLAGARQYKANYYIKVKVSDVAFAYTSSLQNALHVRSAAVGWMLCALVLTGVAAGAWMGLRRRLEDLRATGRQSVVEWSAVVGFVLLPLAGVGLARVASGAFESRYVAEFSLGMAICLAAGLVAAVSRRPVRKALLVAGCALAVVSLGWRARQDRHERAGLRALAEKITTQRTIITDKQEFLWLHTYAGRMAGPAATVWVADKQREIAWSGSDNIDRTMENLSTIAGLPVISYEDAVQRPAGMVVNDTSEPVNWLPHSLHASGLTMRETEALGPDRIYRPR